jgi:nucleotide-binding universal stress UspA family protein
MTVVTGYVPNETGRVALEASIVEAGRRGDRLVVVNTSKGDAYIDRKFATADDLAQLEKTLADSGVEHEIVQNVSADVADAILDVVEQHHARLLVLGLRHRTPVGKLLLGSVSQRLLLDCPCPVLAVKPPRR